ncbi:MAG: serine/threonine-protein phosphatase [Halioglobus sp.]|nr:serine/threonine-protein phosphatase [Halioglobus sp.]
MNTENRRFAAETHPGLARSHNEDCFGAAPANGLWLVADGVGGHSCGEVASAIVKDSMLDAVAQGTSLVDAVLASHAAVLQAMQARDDARGMGSTVVAVRVAGPAFDVCWVGDSRAYLWSRGELSRLTVDHNRAGELLASGAISAEQASRHRERHVLTQSLGVSDAMRVKPGTAAGSLDPGDCLLLCSDGLTDELSDEMIARLLQQHDSPRAQVDALVHAALDSGGNDNITAVVIGDPPDVRDAGDNTLETTRDRRQAAPHARSVGARFPYKAVLLLSALTLAVVWLLL